MNPLATFSHAGVEGTRLRKKKQIIKGVPRMMGSHDRTSYWVFRELSVEVGPGEALVMVSRNPVRTNAAARAWAGLLPIDQGEITRAPSVLLLASPQPRWVRELSVEQTIRMLAGIYGLRDAQIEQMVRPVARTAMVEGLLHRPIEDLGKQIRDQIAFGVARHAPVSMIIFDHTATMGTRPFRETCLDQVIALRDSGKAVVVVTDKPRVALHVGTSAVIVKGRKSQQVSVAEAAEFLERNRVRGPKKSPGRFEDEEDDPGF